MVGKIFTSLKYLSNLQIKKPPVFFALLASFYVRQQRLLLQFFAKEEKVPNLTTDSVA
jgi:hypothetical protein